MKTIIFILGFLSLGFLLNSCLVFQGGGMVKKETTSSSATRSKMLQEGHVNSFYDASKKSIVMLANYNNYTVLGDNLSEDASLNFTSTAFQSNKEFYANLLDSDILYPKSNLYLNTLIIDKAIDDLNRNEIKAALEKQTGSLTTNQITLNKSMEANFVEINKKLSGIAMKKNDRLKKLPIKNNP